MIVDILQFLGAKAPLELTLLSIFVLQNNLSFLIPEFLIFTLFKLITNKRIMGMTVCHDRFSFEPSKTNHLGSMDVLSIKARNRISMTVIMSSIVLAVSCQSLGSVFRSESSSRTPTGSISF